VAGAALCTILLGLNHDNPRYLVACVFAAGFCIIGGQLTLNAFASGADFLLLRDPGGHRRAVDHPGSCAFRGQAKSCGSQPAGEER
jgi:hypothetical protein